MVPGCLAMNSLLTACTTESGALPFISQIVISLGWEAAWLLPAGVSLEFPHADTPSSAAAMPAAIR